MRTQVAGLGVEQHNAVPSALASCAHRLGDAHAGGQLKGLGSARQLHLRQPPARAGHPSALAQMARQGHFCHLSGRDFFGYKM